MIYKLQNHYKLPALITTILFAITLSACGSYGHKSGEHHGSEGDHGHGDEGHHDSNAGIAGKASNIDRTINVDMNDKMEFIPSSISVTAGETIQFKVKNSGKNLHEFVIGTHDEIMEHNELMKKFPGMEHDDEPNSVSLNANESGEVIWQFTKDGTFEIACLQPGHFDAGMRGSITVNKN